MAGVRIGRMGFIALLRKLPVMAILSAGLYAGYSGEIPLVGTLMTPLLDRVESLPLELGAKYPGVFSLFVGLTAGYAIYLMLVLGLLGRKRRALFKLSKIRDEATPFLHNAASLRVLKHETKQKIKEYDVKIIRNAEIVSKHDAGQLRTLFGFDPTKIPAPFHKFPELLHFAERIRRIEGFIKDHG